MRKAVGPGFPIGLRINSSDQLDGGLTETDSLEVIKMLNDTRLDLIDISGGTYFPGAKNSSDAGGRGPYFTDFAKRAKAETDIPIMVTGGFKKRDQAIGAISQNACDLIGVARALAIDPNLATHWTSEEGQDPSFPRFDGTPPPGGITAWYTQRLTAIGEDREASFDQGLLDALTEYEARDAARNASWLQMLV